MSQQFAAASPYQVRSGVYEFCIKGVVVGAPSCGSMFLFPPHFLETRPPRTGHVCLFLCLSVSLSLCLSLSLSLSLSTYVYIYIFISLREPHSETSKHCNHACHGLQADNICVSHRSCNQKAYTATPFGQLALQHGPHSPGGMTEFEKDRKTFKIYSGQG